MNNYEVQLRKAGATLETHHYNIIAASIDTNWTCRETARFVLLPKTKAVKAKRAGNR